MTKKNQLDQFFTINDTVNICINFLIENKINLSDFELIIEPSAGSGNWLNHFKNFQYEAYDISPLHEKIIEQDYLKLNFEKFLNKNIIVIGNPPFGKNSTLAVKFFNYSAHFANFICFIVPRTFRKNSLQKRLNKNFHLINEIILPEYSYFEPFNENKLLNIPTTFQIWKKEKFLRVEEKINFNFEFDWCSHDDNPAYAIRRVGVNAGKFFEYKDQNYKSHFFIKNKNFDLNFYNDFYEYAFNSKLSCKYDVAGNPSITKKEFELNFNNFLNERKI